MKLETKEYLGDGVYVECDGFGIVLTTENGIGITNRVVLEPNMLDSLRDWWQRTLERYKALEQEGEKDLSKANDPKPTKNGQSYGTSD